MIDVSKLKDVYIDNIQMYDYPDFVDAFLESATLDGRDLTEEECDEITTNDSGWVQEQALEQIH